MTVKLSTGMRNLMLGIQEPTVILMAESTIAIVNGGASDDTITDSGSGFVTAGFVVGMDVTIAGSAADDGTYTITGVSAGTLSFATGSFTGESAGNVIALAAATGGSVRDILQNGIIEIRSGSAPGPDEAATGTLLGTITISSGAFSAGSETNGLELGTASGGKIEKASAETWSFEAIATGTAGHFRYKGNATDAGAASTTLPRIEGSISTSGGDLDFTTTSLTSGYTYTVNSWKFVLPEYYGA